MLLTNAALCGFVRGTSSVSDLSPPRLRPSPNAITPPFVCVLSSSIPLFPPTRPLFDIAVFFLPVSARAPPFWSWTYRIYLPFSAPPSLPFLFPPPAPLPLFPPSAPVPHPSTLSVSLLCSTQRSKGAKNHWPPGGCRLSQPTPSTLFAVTLIAVRALYRFMCHSRYDLTPHLVPLRRLGGHEPGGGTTAATQPGRLSLPPCHLLRLPIEVQFFSNAVHPFRCLTNPQVALFFRAEDGRIALPAGAMMSR